MSLNVIAVDDDKLPLMFLEMAIREVFPDAVVTAFRDPYDALE